MLFFFSLFLFFFFNDTATTEIYTLSLHDALPISFAIDTDGRGDEHLLDVMLAVDEDVEEQRSAASVDVHVAIDLIHALTDADRRPEMHDRIGLEHQRLEDGAITDVATDIPRPGVGIRRPRAGTVHLRLEVVEHCHPVVSRNQRINEMGPDVTGAACHEDLTNAHARLTPEDRTSSNPPAPIDSSADRAISRCRGE